MKLVQLLAKELKEWPEGISCMIQDGSGKICTCRNGFPDPYDGDWTVCGPKSMCTPVYWANIGYNKHELAIDQASAIITKEQWQAEREKMNKPKWIRHRGGNQPVDSGITVEYRMRDSGVSSRPELASDLRWDHRGSGGDIMAYRVIEEAKDQEIEEVKVADVKLEMMQGDSWVTIGRVSPDFVASVFVVDPPSKGEEVKDTNIGTLTYKLEIDATESTQQIDSLVAKWGQIESPLKWRDEIIELEAYEEEFRREREKLIRKLESEGFKMIDHVAPVYGEQIIDMSNWRNWQVGDIVECITDSDNGQFTFGSRYAVKSVNLSSVQIVEDDRGSNTNGWGASNFKFSSRP